MSNSEIVVQSRTTDTDGSEVSLIRTITNIYDVRWDVRDVNWTSVYVHSGEIVNLSFGSLGGVNMKGETAVKVYNDLKTALTGANLLETESVV